MTSSHDLRPSSTSQQPAYRLTLRPLTLTLTQVLRPSIAGDVQTMEQLRCLLRMDSLLLRGALSRLSKALSHGRRNTSASRKGMPCSSRWQEIPISACLFDIDIFGHRFKRRDISDTLTIAQSCLQSGYQPATLAKCLPLTVFPVSTTVLDLPHHQRGPSTTLPVFLRQSAAANSSRISAFGQFVASSTALLIRFVSQAHATTTSLHNSRAPRSSTASI